MEARVNKKTKRTKARGQFSDATKARIFAWDNAVCAMTGASLWMLDYGATSLCHYDWADHVKPRARGGSHDAGNGVCVAEDANYEKGANGRANSYHYVAGQATWKAFASFGKVPEDTARYLRRDVLPRDWYFNRAIANLMWFVFGKVEGWTGTRNKAKPMYYPKAAFRFLEDFRAAWQDDHEVEVDPSFKDACLDWDRRGLLPASPSEDQALMLDILTAKDHTDLAAIGKKLMPCLRRNDRWTERFDRWAATCELTAGQKLVTELTRDKAVSPHVRDVIEHNVRVLGGEKLRPRDGGVRVRSLARRVADLSD
jgi:hypothetical protein